MSTDYYVHCKTCNISDGFECRFYQAKALHKHAKAIAALKPLKDDFDLDLGDRFYHVSIDWYFMHAEHELIVKDEYGREHPGKEPEPWPHEKCTAVYRPRSRKGRGREQ